MNGTPWAKTLLQIFPANRLFASRRKVAFFGLAVSMLIFLGAPDAKATTYTWVGGTDTFYSTSTNWSPLGPPAATGYAYFGTGASNETPTLSASTTVGQVGFGVAGYTLAGGTTYTLTLGGNAIAMTGIGTSTYTLGSTGAGTNEITTNVGMTSTNGAFIYANAGNTLQLDGTLATTALFNLSGGGTLSVAGTLTSGAATTLAGTGILDVGGLFTSVGAFTSNTGETVNAAHGYAGGATAFTLGAFVPSGGTGTTSTFNLTGGAFSDTGALNIGTGTLSIGSGASGFTSGTIQILQGGTLALADTGGNDLAAVTTNVYSGGKLVFDDSTNNVNRITTPSSTNGITLNGGEFSLIGNSAASGTSQSAYIAFQTLSASTITLTPNGKLVSLTDADAANGLAYNTGNGTFPGGTLLVRGLNLGSPTGTSGGEAQYFLTTAPLTGASSPGGLVPWALGDTTGSTGQGNTFLSYNSTTGFTPVTETTETFAQAMINGTADNVVDTSSDLTAGSQTINSLIVGSGAGSSGGLTTTLGGTLTLTSGDYLTTSGSSGDTLTGGTLTGKTTRLFMYVEQGSGNTGPDLTVNSTLVLSYGLTKSGAGSLLLNSAVSGTGALDVAQGTLQLGAANIFGANNTLPTGDSISVGSGGTLDMDGQSITVNSTSNNTFGGGGIQTQGAGTITNSSGTLSTVTIDDYDQTSDRFSGNMAFVVNSGGTLYFQSIPNPGSSVSPFNNFTGGITVNQGGELIGADYEFGAYTGAVNLNGGLYDNQGNNGINVARQFVIGTGASAPTTSTIQDDGASLKLELDGVISTSTTANGTLTLAGSSALTGTANFNLDDTARTANPLPSNLDILLANKGTSGTGLVSVNLSISDTIGSLGTGTGTGGNLANTAIGASTAAAASAGTYTLTVGATNDSAAYGGIITQYGTGVITAFAKTGTGTETLSGANNYTGGSAINQGIVDITGASNGVGSSQTTASTSNSSDIVTGVSTAGLVVGQSVTGGSVPVDSYITSIINSTSFTISNSTAATGAGSNETLVFGTYSGLGSGAVTVATTGELSVDNNYASGASSSPGGATSAIYGYSKGGSLGTQGLVPGGLTLSGGTLNLGTSYGNTGTASLGTITTATLTLNSGSMINYQIGGGTNSFIAVTGALSLNGATTVELYTSYADGATPTNASQTAPGVYDLMGYGAGTGALNTSLLTVGDQTAGYTYTFVQDSADDLIQLDVAAVPEPSTWMLFLGGMGMLTFWQRRRGAAGQA